MNTPPLCGYSQALSYERTLKECNLKYYEPAANLAALLNKARKISKIVYEKTVNQLISISDKIENGTATRNIQKLYSELLEKNITKIKKIYNQNDEL